jgi:hypothetical protein
MLAVDASVWLPSAALVLVALITAWGQRGTRRGLRDVSDAVGDVHDEVRTGNHKTIGGLQALSEGRRIQADVLQADRTEDEQGYVDLVEDDDKRA